jgi:hypothetical protein
MWNENGICFINPEILIGKQYVSQELDIRL